MESNNKQCEQNKQRDEWLAKQMDLARKEYEKKKHVQLEKQRQAIIAFEEEFQIKDLRNYYVQIFDGYN